MPFVRMRGVPGLVFTPEESVRGEKKHPCKDCFSCQWCGDDRCAVCLRRQGKAECGKRRVTGKKKHGE